MANITRRDIYQKIQEVDEDKRQAVIYSYVLDCMDLDSDLIPDSIQNEIHFLIKDYLHKHKTRWLKVYRHKDRFETEYSGWLEKAFPLPPSLLQEKENFTKGSTGIRPSHRPVQDFVILTDSTKRRRTASLREEHSAHELLYAAQMKFREIGQHETANALLQVIRASQDGDHASSSSTEKPIPFTNEEAVALISSAHLTKADYLDLRRRLIDHNADVLPSYGKVLEGKAKCYPPDSSVIVNESEATITVQAIFDHTANRLVESQHEVFERTSQQCSEYVLEWKWGFDGSTAHSEYNQTTHDENLVENSIILTAAVPLRIIGTTQDKQRILVWQNERPASTRLCRPVQILFRKETKDIIKEIEKAVNKQILDLQPCDVKLGEEAPTLKLVHRPYLSMIDGKVKSTILNKGPQTCLTCGATPKVMNDIDRALAITIDDEVFKQGISVLHGWLRFLDLCLNVAYRLQIKRSYVQYTQEEKGIMADTKKKIQAEFLKETGLNIDKVKSNGFGNTNDGNMARRFFGHSATTAAITGLDASFLERVRVVMVVLSCGFAVDVDGFRKYAIETARLYVQLYPWYWMSASVHNVLIHGADYIATCPVPIGLFSEEALESRHKDVRRFRRYHTRLCNRTAGNTDLLHALLISSDPVINLFKEPPKRKTLIFNSIVLSLLQSSLGTEFPARAIDLFSGCDDYDVDDD